MKKLMTLGFLTTALAFADVAPQTEPETVKSCHPYVSLGLGPFPLPMPIFGVGGRFQSGHHGADVSLQGTTLGREFSLLKENIDYLYYFNPKLASQFYVGCGLSFTEIFSSRSFNEYLLSPQFLVGKQYINEDGGVRFFQAQIEPVFLNLKRHSWKVLPAVVLSYGICF